MATQQELADRLVAELSKRRNGNGKVAPVASCEIMKKCGYEPRRYGRAFGQAASLLDAACILADLPWLGRLVLFKTKREDNIGPWQEWQPYMTELIEAPAHRIWLVSDFSRIREHIPAQGAAKWWREKELESQTMLDRALNTVRRGRSET